MDVQKLNIGYISVKEVSRPLLAS